MAEQLILLNEQIKATFSTKGAELISLEKNGKEQIWIGDPEVWPSHAPILFPICGGLKEDKYLYNGKEYTLQKHGYIRFTEFQVESKSENKIVFLHRFNEETLKQFPFEYELRIIYTLDGSSLRIDYSVKNLSKDEMYYSIGGHEGYYCPEGIEDYSIIFEKPEMFDSTVLNGNLLENFTINVGKNTCELPLKYEYFAVDALSFLDLKSRKVSLKNRKTGEERLLEFKDHDVFFVWTKPGAKYVCLEPWCGCPDFMDSEYDFRSKRSIIRLSGKEETTRTHTITF